MIVVIMNDEWVTVEIRKSTRDRINECGVPGFDVDEVINDLITFWIAADRD